MPFRISQGYRSLTPEDAKTSEALAAYLDKITYEGGKKEPRHIEYGGFWFDISNPLITGLEGELMLLSPHIATTPLCLLFRLNQGRFIHHEIPGTLWRKIAEFPPIEQEGSILAATKQMFDVANAFESGDYQIGLGLEDVSGRGLSIYSYAPKSLALRGKNIPLFHPLHPQVVLLEQRAQQSAATQGCGHSD